MGRKAFARPRILIRVEMLLIAVGALITGPPTAIKATGNFLLFDC